MREMDCRSREFSKRLEESLIRLLFVAVI
jgi:hypothetical protein